MVPQAQRSVWTGAVGGLPLFLFPLTCAGCDGSSGCPIIHTRPIHHPTCFSASVASQSGPCRRGQSQVLVVQLWAPPLGCG